MKYGIHENFCIWISVPKIYFGTRTHKQIKQIMRELRKTSYKNVRWVLYFIMIDDILTKLLTTTENMFYSFI